MKKNKGRSAIAEVHVAKRKSEDVDVGAAKLKKRKKLENVNNDTPSSPKQVFDTTSSTKSPIQKKIRTKDKKNAHISVKSQEINNKRIQKKGSVLRDIKGSAKGSNESTLIKKKKLKQQAVRKEVHSSADEPVSAQALTVDGLKKKKKKKKNKPLEGVQNLPKESTVLSKSSEEAPVNNTEIKKKKKKKKKSQLNQETLDISAASHNAGGSSPSKSLQKNTKTKPHNRNEKKVSSEGKGALGNQNKKEMNHQGPAKFSMAKSKSKFNLQKGNDEGKDANSVQKKPLKGKALKRHISKLNKTISKLIDFKNSQALLLLKTGSEEKKKGIQSHMKKIDKKIRQIQSEVSAYENGRTNTTEVINQRVYRGLPNDPQTAKKKEKRVDLKEFLQNQLKAARFRWLNENLYTSSSEEAQGFFKEDPESFKAYHEGYSEQVAKWPVNPVDIIIKELKSSPKDTVVADLGCGEAKLAAGLPHLKVHSLDFIALKPEVIACDMAHCPLLRSSVDVAVFCLSLMGTNVSDFLLEANRILKTGGIMEIAEVESRFDSIDDFIEKVQQYGFTLKKKNLTDMFFFLTFKKTQDVTKSRKLPGFDLKACVYKKR